MSLREKKGFFGRLSEKIGDVFMGRASIDEDLFDELEEILIMSDIGMNTTMDIISKLRVEVKNNNIQDSDKVKEKLKEIMVAAIDKGERQLLKKESPLVLLVIGINGGGKTTSIGKIANKCKQEGKTVLLAAADTFRAAAAEQLNIWADRVGVNIVKHQEGADPSAVLFDAVQSAKAKNIDVLICDTAGRLQNKTNLMNELKKMNKVLDREFPEATRETLLVLDATTGKNAVSQAKEFGDVTDLTGVIITKLDGTAKGGIAITIADEFDLPIKYVGVGEGIDDLKDFNSEDFIGGIFDE
ncbi:MAG: signal recognition particle-docking protein FtsY [Eubacteriales bacterium]|nr:signal recognition particle-docking protein FtsY [Eubacteriales bacterium]MDY3332400.1 signal recognition particle-docking protein FtsY [Gallibacter sp.]